jgi:hypothetical protein
MDDDVISVSGTTLDQMNDVRREVLAVFVFGMAYALSRPKDLAH